MVSVASKVFSAGSEKTFELKQLVSTSAVQRYISEENVV